ncbi:hypothetical protein KXD40_002806 [Peronospora effusa]|nr:hypothetical protein KXD40_002806 [Peronospora effusa]
MLRSLHVARSSLRRSQNLRQLSFMSQGHRRHSRDVDRSFYHRISLSFDSMRWVKKEKDNEPFLTKPKPWTDVNKAYFIEKVYRSTSQDVVFRAMARNKAITIHKRISVAQDWLQCYAFDGFCSLVDTSNQAISILGLKQASVSDVTVVHGIQSILEPPKELTLSWAIWCVLVASFSIDGWVLKRNYWPLSPKACLLSLSKADERPVYDGCAAREFLDLCGCLLLLDVASEPAILPATHYGIASQVFRLVITHPSEPKVSIGSVVEPEIENGIRELLLLARPSIDNVYAVQSQWVRPSTFSFKIQASISGLEE